jgi:hypothetical protein
MTDPALIPTLVFLGASALCVCLALAVRPRVKLEPVKRQPMR